MTISHMEQEEEFKFESPIKDKRGGGRKKKYGEETAQRILDFAEENRDIGARKIANLVDINATGLSYSTINRMLNNDGLIARRKVLKPKLSP